MQEDITQGRVLYVHNGGEVGRTSLHDLATVMVSDRLGKIEHLTFIVIIKLKLLHDKRSIHCYYPVDKLTTHQYEL